MAIASGSSRRRSKRMDKSGNARKRRTPSFVGLAAASEAARRVARGTSIKANTRCEVALRRALWAKGLRFRLGLRGLAGRPDIVFTAARVVVFCDGDFWHGRDLETRLARLASGHNAPYWVAKLRANADRDRRVTAQLELAGWSVIRVWETDILRNPEAVCDLIARRVMERRPPRPARKRRAQDSCFALFRGDRPQRSSQQACCEEDASHLLCLGTARGLRSSSYTP